MELIKTYGLTIWLAVAAGCMLLGMYLTARRQRRQDRDAIVVERPRPLRRKLRAVSLPALPVPPPHQTPVVCPACGQQDHPEARYCGACGHPLASAGYGKQTSASRWSTGTRLVTRL
jgi:hypothetical protein